MLAEPLGAALPSDLRQLQVLAGRLVSLGDAVARLREAQAQAAQAAAARRSAEQLHARAVIVQPTALLLHRTCRSPVRGTGARRGR